MRSLHALLVVVLLLAAFIAAGCVQAPQAPSRTVTPSPAPETPEPTPGESVSAVAPYQPETPIGQGVNDTFPFVPGATYHVGDRLVLQQTTILSPGNRILVEVISATFLPTNKSSDNRFYGVSGVATVEQGPADSVNTWSFEIDTRGWAPDEYMVQIEGITVKSYRINERFSLIA